MWLNECFVEFQGCFRFATLAIMLIQHSACTEPCIISESCGTFNLATSSLLLHLANITALTRYSYLLTL